MHLEAFEDSLPLIILKLSDGEQGSREAGKAKAGFMVAFGVHVIVQGMEPVSPHTTTQRVAHARDAGRSGPKGVVALLTVSESSTKRTCLADGAPQA